MKCISLLFILKASLLAAQPAPTGLMPVLATRAAVRLEWQAAPDATGYRVERKTLNSDFAPLLDITPPMPVATNATDSSIDPYETYTYRVRAFHNQEISEPSGTFTVGPPPTGFNVPVPLGDFPDAGYLGIALRMAYDSNGDPALAYLKDEQLGENSGAGTKLYFLSWNRTLYRWNDVVFVGTPGILSTGHSTLPISLAHDASTNLWAIAHETVTPDQTRIDVHFSADNGLTWLAQTLAAEARDGSHIPSLPSIGLAKGKAHVVWYSDYDGLRYATGELKDQAPALPTTLIPLLSSALTAGRASHLALNTAGIPAIAFVQDDAANGYNKQIGLWRPEAGTVKVMDSQNFQIDDPSVFVAYAGDQPRVLAAIRRDDDYFSKYDHSLWLAASDDEGKTWSTPANIAADGGTSLDPTLGLAFGPSGEAAIAAESNGGSGSDVSCSTPKISRSSDLKSWATCGPIASPITLTIGYPSILFMDNAKLYLAFQNRNAVEGGPAPGLVLYREP